MHEPDTFLKGNTKWRERIEFYQIYLATVELEISPQYRLNFVVIDFSEAEFAIELLHVRVASVDRDVNAARAVRSKSRKQHTNQSLQNGWIVF